MVSMKKIRVLIVDDSAVVRQTLEDILSSDPGIEVIGTAVDPYVAAERMKKKCRMSSRSISKCLEWMALPFCKS